MTGVNYTSDNSGGVDGTYISTKVLSCPSTTVSGPWYYRTYGLNWCLSNRGFSYKRSALKSHSLKILFCDTAQNDTSGNPTGGMYNRFYPKFATLTDTGWGWPNGRHLDACNTLHLDGHVQNFKIPNRANPQAAFPFNYNLTDSKPYLLPEY